jgi:hypothetical protein
MAREHHYTVTFELVRKGKKKAEREYVKIQMRCPKMLLSASEASKQSGSHSPS